MSYKIKSIYKHLLEKYDINWMPFKVNTLDYAKEVDKPVFLHIGNISKTIENEATYRLFSNKEIVNFINNNFIAVVLDSEDIPEASLIGLDLLIINKQNFSIPINLFALPNGKPFLSLHTLEPDEFLIIAENILNSFYNKRKILEKAADELEWRLINSGVILEKKPAVDISQKMLHAYVRSWSIKFINRNATEKSSPYNINIRFYVFLLKYAHVYKKKEWLEYIAETLDKLYYSAMFDPINGGFFTRAVSYTLNEPLYEKSFSENTQALALYAMAFKYLKKERYKECCLRTFNFIEQYMRSELGWGYISSISSYSPLETSSFYNFSISELKSHFKSSYKKIATYLGMDLSLDENFPQYIHNTPKNKKISSEELSILKKIRNKKKKQLVYDKRLITADNCMYVSNLCMIYKIFKENKYLEKAQLIIDNILDLQLRDNSKMNLYRYIAPKKYNYSSYLLDYAFFLNASLYLAKYTKNDKYIALAKKYTNYILFYYYNPNIGMFTATKENEQASSKYKRECIMDYSRFSANSVMARNLFLLYLTTKEDFYLDIFKQQLYNVESQLIGSGPFMVGWALQILNYLGLYNKTLLPK